MCSSAHREHGLILGRFCKLGLAGVRTGFSPVRHTMRLAEDPSNQLRSWTRAGPSHRSGSLQTRPSNHSLRHAPQKHPSVIFYTLSAGQNDEIHCTTVQGRDGCDKGALFDKASNVKAQLNLGAGTPASQVHLNFSDGSLFNQMGGDTDGVGHFKVKNNSGQILYTMLHTTCEGLVCKGGYTGGPVENSDK